MEKQITITIPEWKARIMFDNLLVIGQQLDKLYEANKVPSTKVSADVLEEIYEDIRRQIFS
jgi:galactokinase/mevalonate kinase-like predicted kinase